MKSLFLLLAVCLSSTLAIPPKQRQPIPLEDINKSLNRNDNRIIHGNLALQGEIPWQVAVIFYTDYGGYFCGGSLISDQWVLTAGHCVDGGFYFVIILGDVGLGDPADSRVVDYTEEAYLHPEYNPANINNDIALIRLSTPVEFNDYIQPANLPGLGDVVGVEEIVKASGWGLTSDDALEISEYLYYTRLTTISNEVCAEVYGTEVVIESTLCTVGNPLNSTCSGDSGGPLTYTDVDGRTTHVGIVSFGAAAGCELGYPAGFTRTESFLDWILTTTGISR